MAKWFMFVSSVVCVFFLCGFVGIAVAGLLNIWMEPTAGFFSAFAVVGVAFYSAPKYKKIASILVFFLGAIIAWKLLGNSHYPESYKLAYQSTIIPFYITLIGGLLALGIIFVSSYNKE
jgi:hypothetical protein